MKNFTYSFETVDALQAQLSSEIKDTAQTLIQLFCASSDEKKIEQLQSFFQDYFPSSHLIGTTTDGIIDGVAVYVDTKSVVTFTLFEETKLKSALIEHSHHFNDSFETGEALAKRLAVDDTAVILSFADGTYTNGEEFVKGISSIAPDITLSGGLAADNGKLQETFVFNKNERTNQGAVGVSLNSNSLNVATSYTFDWMPIGKKMRVTKAVKNRVYEIDGIAAVDIYAKYMGQELAAQLPQIGIEFPLIFEKGGISIGRAVLHRYEDGSLTFAGNIEEGDSVRFGVGSIETILKNSDYHARKMLDKMRYKSEAVFIYSCMARRRFMNEYIKEELAMLSHLGELSGFFTYGEFFHTEGDNQLLNETMTMLAISEKREHIVDTIEDVALDTKHFGVDSEHVIAHLANIVSNELAELNQNLEKRIKENSDYIYKQAYYDKLTGLPNRLSLMKRVGSSLGKMIVLINIDDFTTINDFYGHEVGDKVLKRLADILRNLTLHESSEVFKLPSDEFAIIINTPTAGMSMKDKLKEWIASIENEEFLIGKNHYAHVSVTIAAALINEQKTGLVNADMTLKLAKRAGKEYMVFNEDLKLAKQYEANINMANTIKNAISNNNNIIPYFQPIVSVATGEVVKYEALVRLKEKDRVLTPFMFLEISQKIKLYPQITEIMIDKTFSFFAKNGVKFSINLSFSDILNEKTREYIFHKIAEYDIASQLTIEILETQENDNEKMVTSFIEEVYSAGACIAIDDFGSGFANFQHMTTMRSDIMKIDGSLIKNIASDHNARLVVETIIIFARKLGKKIVAEFVHSQEVLDIIKELGVDYMQGYFLGEPKATLL